MPECFSATVVPGLVIPLRLVNFAVMRHNKGIKIEEKPESWPLLYPGARPGGTSVNSMLKPALMMIPFAWIPTLLPAAYVPEASLAPPRPALTP